MTNGSLILNRQLPRHFLCKEGPIANLNAFAFLGVWASAKIAAKTNTC